MDKAPFHGFDPGAPPARAAHSLGRSPHPGRETSSRPRWAQGESAVLLGLSPAPARPPRRATCPDVGPGRSKGRQTFRPGLHPFPGAPGGGVPAPGHLLRARESKAREAARRGLCGDPVPSPAATEPGGRDGAVAPRGGRAGELSRGVRGERRTGWGRAPGGGSAARSACPRPGARAAN